MNQGVHTEAAEIRATPSLSFVTGSWVVDYVFATVCSLALLTWSIFFVDGGYHWFVIPIAGIVWVLGLDVSKWVRGRHDMFDPVAIIAVVGIYFFGVAPILHLEAGYWPRAVQIPGDWREAVGWMGALNLLGILLYRVAVERTSASRLRTSGTYWAISYRKAWYVLVPLLFATLALQLYVYDAYGGIMGYISAYEMRYRDASFEGMGWIFSLSESFPILAFIGFAIVASRKPWMQRWGVILFALAILFILNIYFGGLRGSRSNTIWTLFWAAGITHYMIRSVPRIAIVAAVPLLFGFMYIYGFYKSIGFEAFEAISQGATMEQLEQRTTRTREVVLLGDLSRADIQALILHRTTDRGSDYQLALGRSYGGALALLVPRTVWPSRPPTKVKEGSDVINGSGAFERRRRSSRVYGLAGESMLNFGPVGVPLAMLGFGFLVRWVRRAYSQWPAGDSRWLIFPFLVNLAFVALVSDSDNLVFFAFKNGSLPLLIIAICSTKVTNSDK